MTTSPNTCSMCHRPEGPLRRGNFYDAVSPNGMRLIHFWVCNDCAVPLGPEQGGVPAERSRPERPSRRPGGKNIETCGP